MIINQANLAIAFNAFNGAFKKGFTGAPTQYGKLAMTVPSTAASETFGWLGQFPKMREWLGDRVVNSLVLHDYSIKNRDFENTISVPRNDLEDDKYGVFGPIFEEFGRTAAEHPDELILALLKAGFTTTCYDKQFFFDTDHPVRVGNVETSVANTDGGAGTPWFLLDTSRAIKPLIYQERRKAKLVKLDKDDDPNVFFQKEYIYGLDGRWNVGFGLWQLAWGSKQTLNAANYEIARTALSKMRGDEDRALGIRPTLLVVPTSLEGAARRLLTNENNADGASNEWKGTAELLVSPWLD